MKQNMYMLYDTVSLSYVGAPMIIVNDAVAKRSVAEFFKTPNNPFYSLRNDLRLYKIGVIDLESGSIESAKQIICDIKSLLDDKIISIVKESN